MPWVWNSLLPTLSGVGSLGRFLLGDRPRLRKVIIVGNEKVALTMTSDIFRCGYVGHTEAVHDVKDFKQVSNQESNTIQAKLSSTCIMTCFHSCPCREEPLWTLLVGSRSRTGFTIRPLGAGGRWSFNKSKLFLKDKQSNKWLKTYDEAAIKVASKGSIVLRLLDVWGFLCIESIQERLPGGQRSQRCKKRLIHS